MFRLLPSKQQWEQLGHWLWNLEHLFWTIWFLNVVAWGGMIFLLLIGGGKAMCHPSCDDINSTLKIWIEIDSQILNALFCVPAFGLAPNRARDFCLWFQWRFGRKGEETRNLALNQLARKHGSWFSYNGNGPGSTPELFEMNGHEPPNSSTPKSPTPKSPTPEVRMAGDLETPLWKLDFIVCALIFSTVFQALLAFNMWHYSRFNRPKWAVPLWLCVGFACSIAAGIVQGLEKKRVKKLQKKLSEEEA